MKILAVTNWGANDPLLKNSVLIKIKLLQKCSGVEAVDLCIFNRWEPYKGELDNAMENFKVYSFDTDKLSIPIFGHFLAMQQWNSKLYNLIKKEGYDYVIFEGTPVAIISYSVVKKLGIPYGIEYCEPHNQYMINTGVWSKYGLKNLFYTIKIKSIYSDAANLFPVSMNYKNELIKQGYDSKKIHLIPCSVDLNEFKYNPDERVEIRKKEGISNEKLVGIYVGNFFGVYHNYKVLKFLQPLFEMDKNFHFILLTRFDHEIIREYLSELQIDLKRVSIKKALPEEVKLYLSASDFAFSFIVPTNSSQFCSAVKIGEYYASGLPNLISANIGDDSEIIEKYNAGVIVDFENEVLNNDMLLKIKELCQLDRVSGPIRKLSETYRNLNIIEDVYQKLFSTFRK